MAREIERKFLVRNDGWKHGVSGVVLRQGYLSTTPERTVRIRTEGARGVLTVKGLTVDTSRLEFEYEIPFDDARIMLDRLCERPLVEKTRYTQRFGRHVWQVDEFHGANDGLVVAEIELERVDEPFDRPAWLGADVSDDPRYFNANLVRQPFTTWPTRTAQP